MKTMTTSVFKCPKCGKKYTLTMKMTLFAKTKWFDENGNSMPLDASGPICPKCRVALKDLSH